MHSIILITDFWKYICIIKTFTTWRQIDTPLFPALANHNKNQDTIDSTWPSDAVIDFNQNINYFNKVTPLENAICKMSTILFSSDLLNFWIMARRVALYTDYIKWI